MLKLDKGFGFDGFWRLLIVIWMVLAAGIVAEYVKFIYTEFGVRYAQVLAPILIVLIATLHRPNVELAEDILIWVGKSITIRGV